MAFNEGWNLSVRITLLPRDTNQHGTIFGGVILSHIDIAGAIEAKRFCEQEVVTVAMDKVVFEQPVFVGDLVSFYTRIISSGRTSITVEVKVTTNRDRERRSSVHVTNALVTYVAINAERRPEPVRVRTWEEDPPAFAPDYLESRLKIGD